MSKKKDCLFQYAYKTMGNVEIPKDTGLITRKDARKLWNKYYSDVVRRLEGGYEPQMVIWINCKSDTDYHTVGKEINYMDNLVVENGEVFKLRKTKITKFKK